MVNGKTLDTVCDGVALSFTVMVVLKVPVESGLPPRSPAVLRLTPGGSPVALHE
jgi:hypothetical protein